MARIHLTPDLPEAVRFTDVDLAINVVRRRGGASTAQRLRRLAGDTKKVEVPIFTGLNLAINPGEAVAVVPGSKDSGVIELFRLASGTLVPDSGSVERRHHVIPMLTRSGLLNNSITVRQNIWVGALLLGMTPDQVRERFNWIVKFGGLEKILDTYAKQVSPLMRRRVVWTVTMATQARSFAIQRSLVVGDEEFQDRCWEHLDGLKADGVTFLVETTDEMLRRFCERGVVVGNGGVIADTTVEEALKLRRVDETEEAEIQQEEAEDEDWQAE